VGYYLFTVPASALLGVSVCRESGLPVLYSLSGINDVHAIGISKGLISNFSPSLFIGIVLSIILLFTGGAHLSLTDSHLFFNHAVTPTCSVLCLVYAAPVL